MIVQFLKSLGLEYLPAILAVRGLILVIGVNQVYRLIRLRFKSRHARNLAYDVIDTTEEIKEKFKEKFKGVAEGQETHLEEIVAQMKEDIKHAVSGEIISTWGIVLLIWLIISNM